MKVADFRRPAASFEQAVLSAVLQVEEAVPALVVTRLEPDDLVTSGIIATRTGRTRQNIAQLSAGLRGPGGFPAPLTTGESKMRMWRWSDVRDWFAAYDGSEPVSADRIAPFTAAVNGALELRRHLRRYREDGGEAWLATSVEDLANTPPGATSTRSGVGGD